jgi:hypothetical protein
MAGALSKIEAMRRLLRWHDKETRSRQATGGFLMGMRIEGNSDTDTVVKLHLFCDEPHEIRATTEEVFFHVDGFIAEHRKAMNAGWLERTDSSRGRIWICPRCSGKKV